MFVVQTFNPSCLPRDAGDVSAKRCVAIAAGTKLYDLLLNYIAHHAANCQSYAANMVNICKSKLQKECDDCQKPTRVQFAIGLGVFRFRDNDGEMHWAIHQSKGKPVGGCNGIEIFKELIILTDSSEEHIAAFFSELIEASESTTKGTIKIFHFNSKCRYWRGSASIKARPLDSVILPMKTKDHVITDLANFMSDDMQIFYEKHGIPYRRSYLLYGVPGTGKTSFIQAIAGHCNRSISYLQIDPEMTDVVLRSAMDTLPHDTVVVIEDIDALFDRSRQSKTIKGPLTFSGLLNALDGVGCSTGQIFIMTTNLKDQLDPALIRRGRVDVQVCFDYAQDEQLAHMWKSFYPQAAHLAADFVPAVRGALAGRPVTTADLQHFFVREMRSAPAAALAHAKSIADELNEREAEEAQKAAPAAGAETVAAVGDKEGGNEGVGNAGGPGDDSKSAAATERAAARGGDVVHHVHLHLHAADKVALTVVKKAGERPGSGSGSEQSPGEEHDDDDSEE